MTDLYSNTACVCLHILLVTSFAFAQSEDKKLEEELARELAAPEKEQSQTEPSRPRSGVFQNMNPNISVIGTASGGYSSLDALDRKINLGFDEAEFSFQATVDPYAKADFFVGFHKHHEHSVEPESAEDEEDEQGGEGGFEPALEEAYLTLLSLPASMQLKLGKFRSHFGKINEVHPHALNYVDLPLMYSNFFGGDGLNDEGASLSWLVPNKLFFQDLTVQITAGPSENHSLTRAENNRLLYLAHLKNFFDVNANTTLELGLTGLSGPNANADVTNMFAADLTLKWKPLRFNRYRSFEWMSEVLVSEQKGADKVTSLGLYTFLRYQLSKRWFHGWLYDYSEFPGLADSYHQAFSFVFQFFATEFQKAEVQFKYNDGNFFESFAEVKVRAVFVIGAHGAHQY
jgi:hypothetical protein